MKNSCGATRLLFTRLGVFLGAIALSSYSQTMPFAPKAFANVDETIAVPSDYSSSVFKPRPQNKSTIDYSVWNEALSKVVLDFGPSTRLRARKPAAGIGSRFVKGHKSAYRLEGSRFTFEYITDAYRQGLTDYRLDLQDVATKYDITKFPKDEQLAFWMNFHNVAVLEKIAENYPVSRPDRIKIKIGGTKYTLDEAPFIDIMGKTLSLRDIRTKIVFENWDNPNVIYGFFQGEIGSPSLLPFAYTGENIEVELNRNANDFVNSLRGFNLGSSTKNVSAIYEEAAPFYFRNWETDIQSHLVRHAGEVVREELTKPYPFKIDTYDNMIADLSGGQRLGSSGAPTNTGSVSFEIRRMLGEVTEKKEYLRRRDLIKDKKGYVIIEDLVPEEDKVK